MRPLRSSTSGSISSVFRISVALLGVVLLLVGCVSYPDPMSDISSSVLVTPLEVTYEIEPNPDDSKTATVKIGEMRLALVTAERYENAVASQNNAVKQADELLKSRDAANERITLAREVGVHNSIVVGVIGFFAGCAATSILLYIAR